eukprot:25716-Pelagomonas_calceolata.AAC.3
MGTARASVGCWANCLLSQHCFQVAAGGAAPLAGDSNAVHLRSGQCGAGRAGAAPACVAGNG